MNGFNFITPRAASPHVAGPLAALFLSLGCAPSHCEHTNAPPLPAPQVGEHLILVRTGESGVISYGLYCLASGSRSAAGAPPGASLILCLRNNGAKSINMEDVSVDDFRLTDSAGRNAKLYLWTQPRTMGFGEPTIIHLEVGRAPEAPEPWTLHFKTKPGTHVPIDLQIPNIAPSKAVRDPREPPHRRS